MRTIKISISNETARRWEYLLRKLYQKDKRTSLDRLCKIAVFYEVAEAAKIELEKAERV